MTQAIDLRGLVRPQLVEATKREDNPFIAEFRLQPHERGFGHTLGNSMRRMLLSSLRGAAVWGFRVDGVVHEHQTIPGVVEDVHQIIGNLKTLTLSLDEEVDATTLVINKRGAGSVTAAEIEGQGGVTIIDTGHHLFTLQDDRDIRMELYVNKGRGYVESDQHVVEKGTPVDLVRVDAIYNPVRRANFSVAETRVGQRTDYDRLTLTVETNGTITPEEAVSYAAALAQTHFQFFTSFGSHVATPSGAGTEYVGADGYKLTTTLAASIDDLNLSVRSVNSLKNVNIRTLGDLVKHSEDQILKVKNFGRKSLNEIADLLERENLNFGMRFEETPDGLRVVDRGTPPNRAAVPAASDEEEEE
jgi:DNA-directed RNA polymerase subunit alpha